MVARLLLYEIFKKGGDLMTKKRVIIFLVLLSIIAVTGISIAAFGDKGEILGSSFTMGSADIKMLNDLTGGTTEANLVDTLPGPSFTNIGANWSQDYLIKIYNNAPGHIQLTSNADYLTENDPDDLRQIIFVEPINWGDSNNNGIVDEGELGSSFGRKTIVKWKTEGFDLSSVSSGGVKGMVLRFSTDTVSDTKQGTTAVFDFIFDSLSLE